MTSVADAWDLDLDPRDRVPMHPDVPYMAEGLMVSHVDEGRPTETEMVVAVDHDHVCRSHHDWSKVPEGADPSYVCWNCDAVKFPVEVLMQDD